MGHRCHGGGDQGHRFTLSEAARVMSQNPISLQLRFLQTVTEIAAENNSTTLFPLPLDLFRPFMETLASRGGGGAPAQATPALRSGEPLLTSAAPPAAAEKQPELEPAKRQG